MKKAARKPQKTFDRTTVDAAEIHQFESIATQWWDENGPLRPLHMLNPVRLGYLRDQVCAHFKRKTDGFSALKGLTIADIGCGGGLVAEPLCRMGARVTGVDAGAENIKAARRHAAQQSLDIDYQVTTVEKLAATGAKFDVVTALEIVEHVSDPALFLQSCCKLVKKDGMIILSTLNRTPKAYLLGIVAAEYILRWLTPGTHDWKKFVKPSELARHVEQSGLAVTDISGLVYTPLTRAFSLSRRDIEVNYLLTAARVKK